MVSMPTDRAPTRAPPPCPSWPVLARHGPCWPVIRASARGRRATRTCERGHRDSSAHGDRAARHARPTAAPCARPRAASSQQASRAPTTRDSRRTAGRPKPQQRERDLERGALLTRRQRPIAPPRPAMHNAQLHAPRSGSYFSGRAPSYSVTCHPGSPSPPRSFGVLRRPHSRTASTSAAPPISRNRL